MGLGGHLGLWSFLRGGIEGEIRGSIWGKTGYIWVTRGHIFQGASIEFQLYKP
jgi:hypothetical protein